MHRGSGYVVLSPHLDDAVFTFWHVLRSPADVVVVTVFAGIPGPERTSPLERARGHPAGDAMMERRRADDRAALALAGRTARHLDLLDAQYRLGADPDLEGRIAAAPGDFVTIVSQHPGVQVPPSVIHDEVRQAVGPDAADPGLVFCVPLGIGGHPDHRDVGRAGVLLRQHGRRVRFYADIPYVLRHGMPPWLDGDPDFASDPLVATAFAALGLVAGSWRLSVVRLEDSEVRAKIACAQRYGTEFGPANEDFGGILTDPAWMRYEAYWSDPGDEEPSGGAPSERRPATS